MLEKMRRSAVWLVLVGSLWTTVTPSVSATGTGSMAPEIAAADLDGKGVRLSKLRGKVVLVDFWASWCAPCREELPVLDALYKKYRARGLEVIAVNQDRSRAKLTQFLRRVPLSFPVVHDENGSVAGRYSPPKMPSSYLIDRRGLVRHVQAGFRAKDRAALERQIVDLLGK